MRGSGLTFRYIYRTDATGSWIRPWGEQMHHSSLIFRGGGEGGGGGGNRQLPEPQLEPYQRSKSELPAHAQRINSLLASDKEAPCNSKGGHAGRSASRRAGGWRGRDDGASSVQLDCRLGAGHGEERT